MSDRIGEIIDAFKGHLLPVNTTGWYRHDLLTIHNRRGIAYFHQTPVFATWMLPYADNLMQRVDWLRQNCPVHILGISDVPWVAGYSATNLHQFYVMFPRKKDFLHYRMRWDNLVDA